MRELIAASVERGGLPADDVLARLLPLFREVRALHETGLVAPLRGLGALRTEDGSPITLDGTQAGAPRRNPAAIQAAQDQTSAALDVVRGPTAIRDLTGAPIQAQQAKPPSPTTMSIIAGWQRWEHLLGHHDELTDIASLGELLTALTCGLDLADEADAQLLARHERNLFALNPRLHPVLAAVSSSMIAPDRRRRAQDLDELIERLDSYRDQPEDFDLERVVDAAAGAGDRRGAVLAHLRDRLFDVSRRNQLLHFRPTQRSLNLTESSVPLVLDVRNVRASQLFTWGGATNARSSATHRLIKGRSVDLGSVVRWDDAPYAATALDALISTARRDRAEYGQDQLRLVVAFLRWHNLKDDPETSILSPLILAPVILAKQRGVRDSYRLQLLDSEAEVNPVLRHQLGELYGLELPERLDLADADAIEALRQAMLAQAHISQPALSITTVDKPRIELVRHRALVAMQAYRRRRPTSRPTIGARHYAYSYARPGWAPLGIQIFRDRVDRHPIPLSAELGDAPVPRQSVAPDAVVETDTYSLQGQGDANPYTWELDLCSVTLANFNYRTLSLVRDYDALAQTPRPNAAFDELFSTAPRDLPETGRAIPLAERHLVVAADGSQLAAIAQARAGDNFVIQGPPGTGKSQTITNLVADYVARGQRVLFVCQKRAALDVVHARLRAQGLAEICTLVHDSQLDKKAFVLGLRDTYERWLGDDEPAEAVEARRTALITELSTAVDEVARYEQALAASPEGVVVLAALERLIALHEQRWGEALSPAEQQLVPGIAGWLRTRPAVDALAVALTRAGEQPILARSPLARLDPAALVLPRPDAAIAARAQTAVTAIDAVLSVLDQTGGPHAATLADAVAIEDMYRLLTPLIERGQGLVIDGRSAAAAALRTAADQGHRLRQSADAAKDAAAGWHRPLAPVDAVAALAIARRREPSVLKLLSGDWRRVRKLVAGGFDASARQVRPTVTEALELLVARDESAVQVAALASESLRSWGHPDPVALAVAIEGLRRLPAPLAAWRDRLADAATSANPAGLAALAGAVPAMQSALAGLAVTAGVPLAELRADLGRLTDAAGQAVLRTAGPALRELAATPDAQPVLAALRELPATPDQLEYAVCAAAMRDARAASPALERLDGTRLADLLATLSQRQPDLRRLNADVIKARLRARFIEAVANSQRSVVGMDAAGRAQKQAWAAGRRELEHEFGKVRAYKAIRQLASADAGRVAAALRPVWLMSPSSLSDTLPLDAAFDVVIFDEASQIPVEEAVPALYRGAQVIVVGDRMQLPPTQYFQTRASQPLELADSSDADRSVSGEHDAESTRVGVVLDADSFLSVGSVRLPSTMLSWHYRSQYEALIQFSNAAFYEGRLATIPDRMISGPSGPLEVTVGDGPPDQAIAAAADGVLARSISYVRVRDGIYVQRTNPAEANWIAHLVREVLRRAASASASTRPTIGIVAFSEAQQGEIERALERLSGRDPEFAQRYEAELNREEDGQAIGLFVKNLENVQGDERDLIIMSVCYAPGVDGRMRMNFGPINNAGGEKRLNVIFSRARQHMVLVSSIDHTAITNVYNDGANTLKNFLRYAEAVSSGDLAAASGVLAGLRTRELTAPAAGAVTAPIVEQVAVALRGRGVDVTTEVGQSAFRCDLALRPPGAESFTTAVLIDRSARLATRTLDERRVTEPGALASAGWRVVQVLATEWESDPQDVLDRICAAV